jgi:hypothetical protein
MNSVQELQPPKKVFVASTYSDPSLILMLSFFIKKTDNASKNIVSVVKEGAEVGCDEGYTDGLNVGLGVGRFVFTVLDL